MIHTRLRYLGVLLAIASRLSSIPVSAAPAVAQTVSPSIRSADLEPLTLPAPADTLYRAEEAGTRRTTVRRGGRDVPTIVLEEATAPDGRPMRAGSLLVTFRRDTPPATQEAAHQAANAHMTRPLGLGATYRVLVEQSAVAQALAAYLARPEVVGVEPDYLVRATFTPNDPELVRQYGLTKISAPAAWDVTRSSAAIKIAVLDCGIWTGSSLRTARDGTRGHPDVAPKVVLERNFTPSPYGADDLCGHGTHVAGIAAARTNNAIGIAGVGYDAAIMNGKILDDDGAASLSSVVSGLIWAADNGARVITMSLGRTGPCPRTLQDGVNYAWTRGAVIVASAGNENAPQSGDPGNCENVLSVAATDQSDAKASFSNYGAGVDVAAPGVQILSSYADNSGYGYATLDGTSFSAPFVAGLAALVWSTHYGTSPQAVVDRITATSDRIPGTGSLWAYGRVNAAAAVGAGTSGVPAPTGPQTCTIQGVVYSSTTPGGLNVIVGSGTIVGTERDDLIFGSDGDDIIFGLGGNDVICGKRGNDRIDGGPGDDRIKGGDGDDTLIGGDGNDLLKGGTGTDSLIGSGGDDDIRGGDGPDRCDGGADTDTVSSTCESLTGVP